MVYQKNLGFEGLLTKSPTFQSKLQKNILICLNVCIRQVLNKR